MAFMVGELDQRISIQEKVSVSDGMGGNEVSLSERFSLWCAVRPLSGGEKTEFERVNSDAKYLFIVRYPVDIRDSDVIVWNGEIYNIRLRKQPTGRKLYMQIEAERGVAQ